MIPLEVMYPVIVVLIVVGATMIVYGFWRKLP